MCGIAGIINFNQPLKHSEALLSMAESMTNRGPNAEGFMLFNNVISAFSGDDSKVNLPHINSASTNKFRVGFGFRQLKIIDLSDNSHQPMLSIDKRFAIIFNGEIYNYKEIKAELTQIGYSFFSNSDTEVLLNAYIEWQEKALDKFNGMFAFAILDTIKNEVFIARDRMGIKPLYYHKNKHHFVFSSTIYAIKQSKLYKPQINWEGLWQNYRFSIAQRPNTSFKDVFALEPAHFLRINLNTNSIKKVRYWEIPTNIQNQNLSEKQAINLIEESLTKAINYRLTADVELGSFMSGGIDSSLISVLASKSNKNIKTLTLGFKEHKELDEVQQASETAKMNQLIHKIHYANSTDVIQNLEQIVLAYEEPYHHLSANFVLAKMATDNDVKVVLSGLGGDELFGGYDVYNKINLWKKLRKNKAIVGLLPNFHQKIKKAKQLASYNSLGEFYSHYYTTFNDIEISKLFNNRSYSTKSLLENLYLNNVTLTDEFEAMSFYNLKSYISNHQMRAVDHATMAFSIEGRFPLLDHNLIEIAFKIPAKFKIHNNTQKYILKKIAQKHISKSSFEMGKKGLQLPLNQWIKNELKTISYDALHSLKNRDLFNNVYIDKVVKSKNEMKIWQLISTELWLQKFIDD